MFIEEHIMFDSKIVIKKVSGIKVSIIRTNKKYQIKDTFFK